MAQFAEPAAAVASGKQNFVAGFVVYGLVAEIVVVFLVSHHPAPDSVYLTGIVSPGPAVAASAAPVAASQSPEAVLCAPLPAGPGLLHKTDPETDKLMKIWFSYLQHNNCFRQSY